MSAPCFFYFFACTASATGCHVLVLHPTAARPYMASALTRPAFEAHRLCLPNVLIEMLIYPCIYLLFACSKYTVRTMRRAIPPAVPGIHFLSGGMSEEESTLNLQVRLAASCLFQKFVIFCPMFCAHPVSAHRPTFVFISCVMDAGRSMSDGGV